MKATVNRKPFVHNAKVLWTKGDHVERVPEMHDKSWPLCKWWIDQHKNDIQYQGGVLLIVSMLKKEYKEV